MVGDNPLSKIVKIPFNVISDLIRTKNKIFTMRDTKKIYIYKNGVYKNNGSESYIDRAIREECKSFKTSKIIFLHKTRRLPHQINRPNSKNGVFYFNLTKSTGGLNGDRTRL
jgi:hypothetical protein